MSILYCIHINIYLLITYGIYFYISLVITVLNLILYVTNIFIIGNSRKGSNYINILCYVFLNYIKCFISYCLMLLAYFFYSNV